MSVKITASELQLAADQCVKCAVCLPHCPTYAISREETESPRGRITLLQGIVHGRLEPTARAYTHLDNCLNCGRCEQVCPAQVPYTRLLDGSRFFLANHTHFDPAPVSSRQRFAAWLLGSPRALRLLALLTHVARVFGAEKILGNSAPGRWLRWTPKSRRVLTSTPRSENSADADAWLFTGCLTDAFEREIITDACEVAAQFGVSLNPAPSGLCCGALYQHMGNAEECEALTARNVAALSHTDKPIVTLSSGCGRGLVDGMNLSDLPQAKSVAARITDLFALLRSADTLPAVAANHDVVGIYAPCSLSTQQTNDLGHIINRVAQHEAVVLGKGHGCCGAAGDHMLKHPERADQLASPIIDEIVARRLTHVLTPNVGCAWHLRANLAERGSTTVVEHPVAWLARNLIRLKQ